MVTLLPNSDLTGIRGFLPELDCLPGLCAEKILRWLASNQVMEGYDSGGILDPLDNRVIGDHYSTTHFAWGAALLFLKDKGRKWFDACSSAIDFHIRTSKDEYPPGKWDYHWDFNNLALVSTYELLHNFLSEQENFKWLAAIKRWKTNRHSAVNWLAMRAVASWKRYRITGNENDRSDAVRYLDKVLSAQTADGCFDDLPGKSRPSQYHAYSACLLHLLLELDPGRIIPALKRAGRWLLLVTAPDGDMNALGRGQGQVFGYVCAIYLFRALIDLDTKYVRQYHWALGRLQDRFKKYFNEEGWFPLVFNDLSQERRSGWYDYHHLSVYNAFAAVWLLLASELDTEHVNEQAPANRYYLLRPSDVLSIRTDEHFMLFQAGPQGSEYATDAGISPVFLKFNKEYLFRYPFGPGPGKYGSIARDEQQELNCWAPVIKLDSGRFEAPFFGKGSVTRLTENSWELTYENDTAVWHRKITAGKYFLDLDDKVDLKKHNAEILIDNIAIKKDKFEMAGRNTLVTQQGTCIRLCRGNEKASIRCHVTAADGTVAIINTGSKEAASARGRIRLRSGPGTYCGQIPGILCFTWDPWSHLWKRKQRLLFELSKYDDVGNIFYVEPPVTLTEIIENLKELKGKGEKAQKFRRALCMKPARMGKGFFLFSPLLPVPGQRSYKWCRQCNRDFFLKKIKSSLKAAGNSRFILWLYHPSQYYLMDALSEGAELTVYDWTDDWVAAYPENRPVEEKKHLAHLQKKILEKVDVVFCVSEELCRRAREFTPWVYHIPNATDPTIFNPTDKRKIPELLPVSGKGPWILYLSQITDRVDFDLLMRLARQNPQWRFLMAGPLVCPESLVASLRKLANVHFTGRIPYEKAGAIAAACDVCILPHRQDTLTQTLDPIKLYDYLATGRPIVSTSIAMHPELRQLVRIAETAEKFGQQIVKALEENPEAAAKRREAALKHTWKQRTDQTYRILASYFTVA